VHDPTPTRPPVDRLAAARDRERALRDRLAALAAARAAQEAADRHLSQRRNQPGAHALLAAEAARHRAQARLLATEMARTRVHLRRQEQVVMALSGE